MIYDLVVSCRTRLLVCLRTALLPTFSCALSRMGALLSRPDLSQPPATHTAKPHEPRESEPAAATKDTTLVPALSEAPVAAAAAAAAAATLRPRVPLAPVCANMSAVAARPKKRKLAAQGLSQPGLLPAAAFTNMMATFTAPKLKKAAR